MKEIRITKPGRLWLILYLLLVVILTTGFLPVMAADTDPQSAAPEQDPEAQKIFLKMADYIAGTPAFSVTYRSSYDAIQPDGQRIEFGEKLHVLLQRPNQLRVETERSDGRRGLVIFDGQWLTVFKAEDNVYARIERPGTVDQILVYLVRDLQVTLPMARLFVTGFPEQMEKRISAFSYVEENMLFDVPTDHLAVRTPEVDMQMWIAEDEPPLPRRIVLTYKNASGEPQFRADFLQWSIPPTVGEDSFTFTPPAGAEQIPLLAPVVSKGSIPLPKGEKQ